MFMNFNKLTNIMDNLSLRIKLKIKTLGLSLIGAVVTECLGPK